jgi:hypothetical protein
MDKFKAPDDIIRNPMRNMPREIPNFEPEYQRLGITPVKQGEDPFGTPAQNEVGGADDYMFDLNGQPVDLDQNRELIDNNDYVFPPINNLPRQATNPQQEAKQSAVASSRSDTPKVGEYILMVNGKLMLTSNIQAVEQKVKRILYKEEEEFSNDDIGVDDIVVLKRIDIRIGVFLGE